MARIVWEYFVGVEFNAEAVRAGFGEAGFHGLIAFNVVLCVAKETVFRLEDRVFLAPVAELPIHVDQTGFRQVFERRDDAVTVLARGSLLDLKCLHWVLSSAALAVHSV